MAKGTLNSNNNAAASSGSNAVVTLAADSRKHRIRGISWSYAGDPTSGSLKIEDGSGNVVYGPLPITSGGPGILEFPWGESGSDNTALIVTLADGGASKVLYVHVAP